MTALFSNVTLWLPIILVLLVQFFKFVRESILSGTLQFRSLTRSGGMPSSHSAMVTSLATAVAFRSGVTSTDFAIATVLAAIVMHDARGIRQQSGIQAVSINRLMREVFTNPSFVQEELKERLGHTSMEVLVGGTVGVVFVYLFFAVLGYSPN